jgi:hypothetical protein
VIISPVTVDFLSSFLLLDIELPLALGLLGEVRGDLDSSGFDLAFLFLGSSLPLRYPGTDLGKASETVLAALIEALFKISLAFLIES